MSRLSLRSLALLAGSVLAATGCTATASTPCAWSVGDAPSEFPAWLFAPDSIVRETPELAGPFVKDTFTILFMPYATHAQRAHAIASVGGCVVAHTRDDLEGEYYVRVPGGGASVILRAVDRLNELPCVAGATVLMADDPRSMLDSLS